MGNKIKRDNNSNKLWSRTLNGPELKWVSIKLGIKPKRIIRLG
jgi:hypothetical protein